MTVVALFTSVLFGVSQANAQSGTRGGGGSSFGGYRPSNSERRQIARQRRQELQREAVVARQQLVELSKIQFKQSLANLVLKKNTRLNSRQNRVAFDEAKADFRGLRSGNVSPGSLGPLRSPFRLTSKELDRNKRTASWPKLLRTREFREQVVRIDSAIMDGRIDTSESAGQFLSDLNRLNQRLNTAALRNGLSVGEFARARRFITGLANEVRATNLVM